MTKVLVVDDEEMIRINLIAFLEDESFDVVEAASGEEAVKVLEINEVDIGIIDMRLPGMDGNALIQKAHEINPKMKFLIHTGSTDYSLPMALQKIGIKNKHILNKPVFNMGTIIEAIEAVLAGGQ